MISENRLLTLVVRLDFAYLAIEIRNQDKELIQKIKHFCSSRPDIFQIKSKILDNKIYVGQCKKSNFIPVNSKFNRATYKDF